MESIKKVMEQLPRKYSEQSINIFQSKDSPDEISLYKGPLTGPVLFRNVAKIQSAFPSLPQGFYDILTERLADTGFTDDRLNDAVNNVIDNCIYPTPTIAQFISWDKRVKVYKYPEIVKMLDDDPKAFDRYKRIEMEGLPEAVYIHINDIAKYKIEST